MSTSSIQAKIPFKSRKKISVSGKGLKKSKGNEENWDSLNSADNHKKILKRRPDNINGVNSDEEEDCSPTKISRNGNEGEDKSESDTVEVTAKPLPSRETEIEWLENYLIEHSDAEKSGSLYISGQPGTGKTASLSYILQLPKINESYKQVYVNCTMMKSATSIYSRICKELQLKSGSTEKAYLNAIEKYLTRKHKMILLVLDEIDQLDSKRQSVLYTIFSWPSLAGARLVLVGVANALDLTERALPRLQARCSLRPTTLHFAPYTKQQIINIFTTILTREDNTSIFSPVALQMLAAKISAISGDMRRALDIGRRVVEVARRSRFAETGALGDLLAARDVTVELRQVLQVLADVYGGSTNIDAHVDDSFPMHQKLILCSLMLILTKGKNKDVVLGKLHDVYKRVAAGRNIAALDLSEMMSACGLLEARGAVAVAGSGAGGGAARARRVRLRWDADHLAAALGDKPLLAAILHDDKYLAA